MADPTPEAGFRPGSMAGDINALVCDFDRAISLAWLSGLLVFLVQQARELCWHKGLAKARSPLGRNALPDPEPFAFDVEALASLFRCHPKAVKRGISVLLKMKILVRFNKLNMVINKNYMTWINLDGSNLLHPDQVEYAKSGSALGGFRLPIPPRDTQTSMTETLTPSSVCDAGNKIVPDENKIVPVGEQNCSSGNKIVPSPPNGAGAGSDARSRNSSLQSGEENSSSSSVPGAASPARIMAMIEDVVRLNCERRGWPGQFDEAMESLRRGIEVRLSEGHLLGDVHDSVALLLGDDTIEFRYWNKCVKTNLERTKAGRDGMRSDAASRPRSSYAAAPAPPNKAMQRRRDRDMQARQVMKELGLDEEAHA